MSPAPRKSSAGRSSARGDADKPRAPRCKTCGRRIHVPKGWSSGPAVRKHYWAKHPEVMRGPRRAR